MTDTEETSFQNSSENALPSKRKTTNVSAVEDDNLGNVQKDQQEENDGHNFGRTTSYAETLLHLLKSNIGPGNSIIDLFQ